MTKTLRTLLCITAVILGITGCTNPSNPANPGTNNQNNVTEEQIVLPQEFDPLLSLFGKMTDTNGNVIDNTYKEIYTGKYTLRVIFESNQSELASGLFGEGTYQLFNTENGWNESIEVTPTLKELSVRNNSGEKIGTKTVATIIGKKDKNTYKIATKDTVVKYVTNKIPNTTIEEGQESASITFDLEIEVTEK